MAGNDAFGLFNLYLKKYPNGAYESKPEQDTCIYIAENDLYIAQCISPLHALILAQQ